MSYTWHKLLQVDLRGELDPREMEELEAFLNRGNYAVLAATPLQGGNRTTHIQIVTAQSVALIETRLARLHLGTNGDQIDRLCREENWRPQHVVPIIINGNTTNLLYVLQRPRKKERKG